VRASLAHDFEYRDRRTLGLLGTLDGDQWVESVRILTELAPDVEVEPFRILAWNRHGGVAVTRAFGTPRDGGPLRTSSSGSC